MGLIEAVIRSVSRRVAWGSRSRGALGAEGGEEPVCRFGETFSEDVAESLHNQKSRTVWRQVEATFVWLFSESLAVTVKWQWCYGWDSDTGSRSHCGRV